MSVLRAILGRFARFLLRVARRLDPTLIATTYWAVPERMAALRARYPGAPEHWLELIARRTMIAGPSEPPAPRADPVVTSVDSDRNSLSPAFIGSRGPPERTVVPFPNAVTKLHPIAQTVVSSGRPAKVHATMRQASPRQARLLPSFFTMRVRNPIANLLRIERPKRLRSMLHFNPDGVGRKPRDLPRQPEQELVRSKRQTMFPDPWVLNAQRPEWPNPGDTREGNSDWPNVRWPEYGRAHRSDPAWPNDLRGSARPNPDFAAEDNRWPELWALTDDAATPLIPVRDEAALRAEQIGGIWSE
jgi:hypothetical protein